MSDLFEIDDFLKNKNITNLKVNEDKAKVAFNLASYDEEVKDFIKKTCILDISTKAVSIPSGFTGIRDFFWKDEKLIGCAVDKKATNIIEYDTNSGSTSSIAVLDMVVSECVLAEEYICFTALENKCLDSKTVETSTLLPVYSEAYGVLDEGIHAFYSYSLKTGKLKKLTDRRIHVKQISNYCGTKKVAFLFNDLVDVVKCKSSVYLYDIETDELDIISELNRYKINDLAIVDKNTLCFLGTECLVSGRNENYDFYKIDIASLQTRKLTNEYNKTLESGNLISDSIYKDLRCLLLYRGKLYFRIVENHKTILCHISMDGKVSTIYEREGSIDSFAFYNDKLIYVGMNLYEFHDVFILIDERENKLTSYNDWLDRKAKVIPEHFVFKNSIGIDIDGWVLKPVKSEANKLYPGILKIHGGPKIAYGNMLSLENQMLVQNGYYVIYCNPRGSDGKGNKFADIRGDFAAKAYSDLMEFVEDVIKKYDDLDDNRLGVMGGSYGGYMVNYIIGKTNLFKAAVSERGISNLISAFNTSDIGYQYFLDYVGKDTDIWQNRKCYIDNSPIFFCDKVNTPTLFIHGKDDMRCNYTESLQMYSALKFMGVDTKICLFKGEKHTFAVRGKPVNRLRRLNEIIDWFNKYLL
jgi:dipeptidyl aminopeptidase/acylaminoacyl peptidase